MKIAIIHHQYAKKGGMESYLFSLIKGFIAHGDKITVLTYRIDPDTEVPKGCEVIKYNLGHIPKFLRKYYFFWKMNKEKLKSTYDLTLTLTRTTNQDIAICGGTHRGFLKFHHNKRWCKLKDLVENYYEQRCFDNSKQIIACSRPIGDEIKELYGIDTKKIKVAFPPIDTGKFRYYDSEEKIALKRKYKIDPGKTTLLFPSTGHKRKGWMELSYAMRSLSKDEFELIVAGSQIKQNELLNIRSMGFVENMAELYAAVDYTILPAHHEPFGLVVIESLQCGTPVIISKNVGAKELLNENEALIIERVTTQNIAETIKKAATMHLKIEPNFAEKNHLDINSHVSIIAGDIKC